MHSSLKHIFDIFLSFFLRGHPVLMVILQNTPQLRKKYKRIKLKEVKINVMFFNNMTDQKVVVTGKKFPLN